MKLEKDTKLRPRRSNPVSFRGAQRNRVFGTIQAMRNVVKEARYMLDVSKDATSAMQITKMKKHSTKTSRQRESLPGGGFRSRALQ